MTITYDSLCQNHKRKQDKTKNKVNIFLNVIFQILATKKNIFQIKNKIKLSNRYLLSLQLKATVDVCVYIPAIQRLYYSLLD